MFDKIDELFSDLKSEVSGLMQENCSLKRKLEQLQEPKQNKKWKPQMEDVYFFVGSDGEIYTQKWCSMVEDTFRLSIGNYFETEGEANKYLENLKTKAELKALAEELNGEEVIDWTAMKPQKYYIYLNSLQKLEDSCDWTCKTQGAIYCLDSKFFKQAIERIGEQRLIDMIKAGV